MIDGVARISSSLMSWLVAGAFMAACGGRVSYEDHGVGAKGGARDAGPVRDAAFAGDCSAPIAASADHYAYFFFGNDRVTLYGLRDGDTSSPILIRHADASEAFPGALAFDATHIYYAAAHYDSTHDNDVVAFSPGRAVGPRTLVSGTAEVTHVTSDVDALYVVEKLADSPLLMTIGSIPINGACPTPGQYRKLAEMPGVLTTTIAAHGGYVYWNELSSIAVPGSTGVIKRMPTAGGESETLAASLPYPAQLAVDDTGLYWVDFGNQGVGNCMTNGDLQYIPTGAHTPVTLAANLINALGLTVDQGNAYVSVAESDCATNPSAGSSIVRVSVASHETTTLASDVDKPTDLHVQGANLYFMQRDAASGDQVPAVLPL